MYPSHRAGWYAAAFSVLLHGLILLFWPDAPARRSAPLASLHPEARLVVSLLAPAVPLAAAATGTPMKPRTASVRSSLPARTSPAAVAETRSAPPVIPDASGLLDDTPALDTESLRAQARQLARKAPDDTPQLPPGLRPAPKQADTPLARAIDKTARADCRNAHAGAGLLAVFPLIYDTVRDKGCKW